MKSRLKAALLRTTDVGLRTMATAMPSSLVQRLAMRLIGDADIALCFHRVGGADDRASMLLPELCHDAEVIDDFIRWFAPISGTLTMSFDDGYADAAQYVLDRAPQHPDVRWHFHICPHKTIDRHGFPWDDWIEQPDHGPEIDFLMAWKALVDNARPEAAGSPGGADRAHCRLATVEECRALAALPNVELGNHTDRHLPSAWLSPGELADEITTSHERFSSVFGPAAHVALPFGAEPWVTEDNVRTVLDTVDCQIWTIGSSPPIDHDRLGSRFAMRSTDGTAKCSALVTAVRCRLAVRRTGPAVRGK